MGYLKYFVILLIALSVMIIPSSAFTPVAHVIDYSATVYIGEEGLNMSLITGPSGANFGYWRSSSPTTTSPEKTIFIGPDMVEITDSEFYGYTGYWYKMLPGGGVTPAFQVVDPRLDISIMSSDLITNLNDKTISPGQSMTFKLSGNIYNFNNRYTSNSTGILSSPDPNVGFVNIKVSSPDGGSYSSIVGRNNTPNSVQNIFMNTNPYIWGNTWNTSAVNSNKQKIYSPGTYNVYAEYTLNGMNDNIIGNRTGRSVSSTRTVTIGSTSLSLSVNTESIMKNKPFSVTVIGSPNSYYNLWVKDTNQMGSGVNSQPPSITPYQEGVNISDPITANYTYQNGGGKTIAQNTPSIVGQSFYANISTSSSGNRIVQFETGSYTKSGRYTIKVEGKEGNEYKYDEVLVVVQTGSITIVAKDYQSFYLGEVIKLSGENSVSQDTYLFITGPNLPSQGSQINSDDPRNSAVINNDPSTFKVISVDNGEWDYDWGTAGISLDSGTYTIYAVSTPSDRNNLKSDNYATLSLTVKKPFISATVSQPTVAKGDRVYIRGVAEGNPSEGIAIWIMGVNYAERVTQSINSGSLFEYEITGAITSDLTSGQYFVIVQHPMQNGQFDIVLSNDGYVINRQLNANSTYSTGLSIFKLTGSGSLQGSDAAEALIEALDDQNIDDTYTRLQFVVDNPYITIDTIGDRHIGDKFTITAKTNLAVDDEINVEIYSSSFHPTEKISSGEFSGATGTVKVTKGETYNRIIFDVDASTFKEDEYIIMENAITVDASGSSVFNVRGMVIPTSNTTNSNTTVTTNTTVTIPTPIPTPLVTPTPVPTQKPLPGFGALMALAGIVVVGIIIVKRK